MQADLKRVVVANTATMQSRPASTRTRTRARLYAAKAPLEQSGIMRDIDMQGSALESAGDEAEDITMDNQATEDFQDFQGRD